MEKLYRLATALVFLIIYLDTEWLLHAMTQYHRRGLLDDENQNDDVNPFLGENDLFDIFKLRERRNVYCGKKLTNELQLVCNGRLQTIYKKSEDDGADQDFRMEYETSTFPFRSRHLAKALIPGTFKRFTRGIVDECCKKSCTIQEMRNYCAP